MNIRNLIIILVLSVMAPAYARFTGPQKIGLLVVATGKYIQYVEPLIASARIHFCPKHTITYFIFTDGQVPQAPDVIKIEQKKLGWPYDTMMRFSMYYNQRTLLEQMDYLFACDSDMLFVDLVGDEILGDRVATLHPGYVGTLGTYERRESSTACVKFGEGKFYFAGGFYGGASQEFLKMAKVNADNIVKDLSNNIVAIWHDESHLNRYFINQEPSKVLSPSYCYPEELTLTYPKKLLALFKNHTQMRAD